MSKPKPDPAIGRRIRQRREQLGMARQPLAQALGVRPQAVERWEVGTAMPARDFLERVAQALGTSAAWLRGESEAPDWVLEPCDLR